MRDVVFDIETNGLLRSLSLIWICVIQDLNTDEVFTFSDWDDDPKVRPMSELPKFLDEECRMLAGHNILSFDFPAMDKVLNWQPKPHHKLVDTLIMSQVLNYKRFGFGHSLGRWGEALKHPKPEHEDWNSYSQDMRHRCTEDVGLNVKVYKSLV